MKLCGQISVELSVDDFIEAADHQRRLEDILRLVRDSYPEATLAMRERRQRKPLSLARAPEPPASGALRRYADE
ncbi:hypothetical protein [Phenylobacterium sp.]|uniref:hypothetical protein n=1 Tax=Phenylobacterium sp. TaxID=1871053 RepID=UPI002D0A5BFE|nr:hypothetical protein [Phenylobacterium sp.]HVI32066.1 hypothetical protein [Phenylobacterium sp.]